MAKKITFVMLVLLIVSAFVFVSCDQEAAGGGGGGGGAVKEEPKDNLIYNGFFEKGDDTDLVGDGASVLVEQGIGMGNTAGLSVTQNESYGEVMVDITDYYGAGKSYYVEASFKNTGTKDDDLTAHLAFNIVTGGAYDVVGQTYDIPGQYDGGWLEDADAEALGYSTNAEGEDLEDGAWHTVAAILTGDEIAAVMAAEDEANGVTGETTMYELVIVFFVGSYPDQDGYEYILDNVYIKDLNPELPRQGKTYIAPPEPEDPGEGGDEGGEGGGDE